MAGQASLTGHEFLTGDGLHTEVVAVTLKRDVIAIPRALTPIEVITVMGEGSSGFLKVVPWAQIGAETYVASLSSTLISPLIACGVTQQNASKFIVARASALGVGRELIPDEAVRFLR